MIYILLLLVLIGIAAFVFLNKKPKDEYKIQETVPLKTNNELIQDKATVEEKPEVKRISTELQEEKLVPKREKELVIPAQTVAESTENVVLDKTIKKLATEEKFAKEFENKEENEQKVQEEKVPTTQQLFENQPLYEEKQSIEEVAAVEVAKAEILAPLLDKEEIPYKEETGTNLLEVTKESPLENEIKPTDILPKEEKVEEPEKPVFEGFNTFENSIPIVELNENETTEKLSPTTIRINEGENLLKDQDLNKNTGTKTVKKSFNFRTNKSKIESILKKESSSNRASIQSDFGNEPENTIISALESTLDSTNQTFAEKDEDKDGSILKQENLLKIEEEIEPQVKPRGFNFKNPKKRVLAEKKSDFNIAQELSQSENIDPTIVSNDSLGKSPSKLDNSKAEVKKARGFNFRNPGKVKVE